MALRLSCQYVIEEEKPVFKKDRMKTILIRGYPNVREGDIIRVSKALEVSKEKWMVPSIENVSNGETANFGTGLTTYREVRFERPVTARVIRVHRGPDQTEMDVDEMTKEVFLSYSHLDKNIAGHVKQALEKNGFACFLAHEEIEVNAEWRGEIKAHLQSCDCLVPIITPNFLASPWANQETGYALGFRKAVVPFMIDGTQMEGLVEEKQGVGARSQSIGEAADLLAAAVKKALQRP